eukprot:91536-Rhodomonas_salina.1
MRTGYGAIWREGHVTDVVTLPLRYRSRYWCLGHVTGSRYWVTLLGHVTWSMTSLSSEPPPPPGSTIPYLSTAHRIARAWHDTLA